MSTIAKALHALAVALFFGSVVFFTVAGALMLNAFENEALKTDDYRPSWFPVPDLYSANEPPEGLPSPARKEQGSRAFGVAVGSIFPFYFALQAACAGVALLTAPWMGGRVRLALCGLALVVVLAGWGLERHVERLRGPRNKLTEMALKSYGEETVRKAREARAEFGQWHMVSLGANFVAMALSGCLAAMLAFPKREEVAGPGT